jgi:hypothetical protein
MMRAMFLVTLILHSLLRWVVLIFGLVAIARGFLGWFGRKPWTPLDDKAGRMFVIALDVQTVIGLLLYGVLSPITRTAFSDMGSAMRDSVLRFFAVEHLLLMLVAVGLVHVGRARTRRRKTDLARHRTAAIFYLLGMIALLAGIPWPGMPAGRPLLPTF